MKKLLFLLPLAFATTFLFSQGNELDSLKKALLLEKTDTGKILTLCYISNTYQNFNPDSALIVAQQAHFMASKSKYLRGESRAFYEMASAYNSMGNYPKALENYLQQLKIEEIRNIPWNIASSYLNLAIVYINVKDYDNALFYAKICDSIVNANNYEDLSIYSLLDLGDIYEKKNNLDSALYYVSNSLAKAQKADEKQLMGTAYNNLGNIYLKLGKLDISYSNFIAGLPYQKETSNYSIFTESLLGLAKVFEKKEQLDSSLYFGKESFHIAYDNQFLLNALDATVLLTRVYKKTKNIDSSYAYQETMIMLKDSIDSRDKIKHIQFMTTEEEIRQKEIAEQKQIEIKERNQKLQLLLIGLSIPIFFLLSVMISRNKVHRKLIEFFGVVSILMLFEYITLLLHPFVAEKTGHSPFYEIIIFVMIAALITPLHHRFQHWVITKLTEMNYLKHHKPEPAVNENVNEEIIDEDESNIDTK